MQEDDKHPFERLPESWQHHPVIMRAWLVDLSRRSNSGSHPQEVDTPIGRLPLPLVLLVILAIIIASPDRAVRFLLGSS